MLLGEEEQHLLHLVIEQMVNEDGEFSFTCGDDGSLMTKVILLEAANRLGLSQKVEVKIQQGNILQCIR